MNLLSPIKNHIHHTLLEDIEYQVSATPKTSFQNLKRYIRFQVKRFLPKGAIQIIRFFLWFLSFSCHYFRPSHMLKKILFSIRKERHVAIYGGFGDLLMMIPFFKAYAEKYKHQKLYLIYNDPRYNKFQTTSYWGPLYFKTSSGQEIVPIKDFLQNLPYFEAIIPGDIWNDGYDCWFAPHVAKRLKGAYFKPSEYTPIFNEIFSKTDLAFADQFFKEHKLQNSFVITLHFRTSVEKLKQLYQLLIEDHQMKSYIHFLLLGSTQHDPISAQEDNSQLIDLRDNYEKGINIRQLLAVAKKSHLYLGGRGGFDLFFWLTRVPAINIFDLQGKGELEKMWPEILWKENRFDELYWAESFDAEEVYRTKLRPYFEEWLCASQRSATQGFSKASRYFG